MDDFPEGLIKEEDSMMDVLDAEELDTTGEDYRDFRAHLSAPVSAPNSPHEWTRRTSTRKKIVDIEWHTTMRKHIAKLHKTGEP
ncbi:hypothetical protein OS493_026309 [Desmophyllum pertusum]|uniref:Uncharacterized protein n=1 Tax=Desmophyllum pertusum TaxID=174260 RepID=A0A9W9ZL84_9CNID|nr:hypothetical protein OS493_026309 [Desmophyllum pertusum]